MQVELVNWDVAKVEEKRFETFIGMGNILAVFHPSRYIPLLGEIWNRRVSTETILGAQCFNSIAGIPSKPVDFFGVKLFENIFCMSPTKCTEKMFRFSRGLSKNPDDF